MKLLIVTQVIDADDPVLGFFVRWVEEFAKHVESVEIICLREGKHDFQSNVKVYSLGKEYNTAPSCARRCVVRIAYTFRFLALVWRLRHNYDSVFVHMNPEYIVLGGKLWRLLGKRISLWYTHKNVDWKLRIAVLFSHIVFTASPESFRIKTKKLKIVGHGIDMAQFAISQGAEQVASTARPVLRILTVGRLSATKRIMEMLSALDVLFEQGQDFTFTIVGAPATSADVEYEKQVRSAVSDSLYAKKVKFLGAVVHKDVPSLLATHNVFLNLSTTGSMDKAVLEAIATGMPVVTTNIAFRDLLSLVQGLFITEATPEKIVNALVLALTSDVSEITHTVRERFALPHTIATIVEVLTSSQ